MRDRWKTKQFCRMWPRALFHNSQGRQFLEKNLDKPGVYVLYRADIPYYIGKTGKTLFRRLRGHALKPNWRRYNFWDYFSAFEIENATHRDEVEAILIAAMPTANSAKPKFERKHLDRTIAKLLNAFQSQRLAGMTDAIGEPDGGDNDDEEA